MRKLEVITQSFGYRWKYQPETHYQPESSSRADNGCGLILRAITKSVSHIPIHDFNSFGVKVYVYQRIDLNFAHDHLSSGISIL